jgi:hypothetical protein
MTPASVLLGSSLGVATTSILGFFAEISANTTDLGPWVQGGTATIAVTALAYIAKLFAQGQLVARDSAEAEKKLAEANADLVEIVKAAQLREDRLFEMLLKGK